VLEVKRYIWRYRYLDHARGLALSRKLASDQLINGLICRGARSMLGLSQEDLSERAGCGRKLLNDFENDIHVPSADKVLDLRRTLEECGAVFLSTNDGIGIAVTVEVGSAWSKSPRARTRTAGE
jgi:DNA-binding XRE family transcriptional regulator